MREYVCVVGRGAFNMPTKNLIKASPSPERFVVYLRLLLSLTRPVIT